jgi:putative transposase
MTYVSPSPNRQFGRIFFITTNISSTVPLLRPQEMDLLMTILDSVRHSLHFLLIGYVVLPDHVHLLLGTETASISHIMHQWKFRAGYAVQRFRRHSGAFWQPRYFDFICRRYPDVSNKLVYIHQNPVVANLVIRPEDWKWSSAASYLKTGVPPIQPDLLDLPSDPNAALYLSSSPLKGRGIP